MTTSTSSALPPLVEPGEPLTPSETERYSRHLLIPEVGSVGQRRLRRARVLVLGAGGLGSPALLYLAAAGVGTIGIVDFDTVERSNLQRQIVHTEQSIGMPKTASAAEAIERVNPGVRVVCHNVRMTTDTVVDVFAGYDLVLDGTDNFATRYLVNDACAMLHMPYVWGSISRFEGQVSVFWADYGPNYRDVYPTPPPAGSVPSCAEGGVLGVLCASIGSIMATEAIKLICGIGRSLLGRLIIYDALEMSYRTVNVSVDPAAAPISGFIDYDEFCGVDPAPGSMTVDGTADSLSPVGLKSLLDAHEDLLLVDVREPGEHELVAISGDVLIPQGQILTGAAFATLPRDRDIVLYCHSGVRSAACLKALRSAGFGRVRHLKGGIAAWADEVDPSLPRY
ncbi:MAG: molybdopterin-synthase adenylyltransferase MoeB [Nakamurella sp.]